MAAVAPQTGTLAAATWEALGMAVLVQVRDAGSLADARGVLEEELAAADAAYSPWRQDTELERLHRAAGRGLREVGPVLYDAISGALEAAAQTQGALDPTVGTLLGPAASGRPGVRRVPGWWQVVCDPDRRAVRLPAGVRLDLGATGKALIADRAVARIAAAGPGTGVLVAVGGDLACAGPAPDGGWVVRVAEDHRAAAGGQLIRLSAGGLATSSTTVRGRHILDPATGRPPAAPWRTASVAAATCTDANAASTAAVVLGVRAPAWLAAHGLPARLVAADGSVRPVAGWPAERFVA
jgi:thiamine biosynthesis lipoprotein